MTCSIHASPTDCLTERLARITLLRNNRKPWRGSGYFCFMMSTTSVANATIKYIASNVDTIPPPFLKGVANRPSTTCYAYYSIISRLKIETSMNCFHTAAFQTKAAFLFPAAQFAAPSLPAGPSFPPPAYSSGGVSWGWVPWSGAGPSGAAAVLLPPG